MVTFRQFSSNVLVQLNQATDRTFALPILIFFPTARCNSRCVSCDCWRADGAEDLTRDEIRKLADELPALRTRLVTFSGGEPTLRRDVYEIAGLFRARDVTRDAFGRKGAPADNGYGSSTRNLLLTSGEVREFARVVEATIVSHAGDFESRFVAEPPEKLRRLPQYYGAQQRLAEFPAVRCNAPWASAVVEADGAVRPCFFHRAVGNIRQTTLREIMANEMVTFRRGLHMADDATCRRCVCSLHVGLRT